MLKNYGYTDENIIVLHIEENPSVHPEYVDYLINDENLAIAFDTINQESTENDFIFIYGTDHGDCNADYTHSKWFYIDVWDHELAVWVNSIQHYARMMITLQHCFSGGFIDDLSKEDRIIATSAPYCWISFGGDPMSQFSDKYIRSLSGFYDADSDGNGYISVAEAWNYAFDHDTYDYIMYDDDGIPLNQGDTIDTVHHGYPDPEPYYQNDPGEPHEGENKYYWDIVYESLYGAGSLNGNHIDGPGYHGKTTDPINTWNEGLLGSTTYL
jgi:hypothetical protein